MSFVSYVYNNTPVYKLFKKKTTKNIGLCISNLSNT